MPRARVRLFFIIGVLVIGSSAGAQTNTAAALRVFLDCNRCDFDYLRTEITFVDYVRDRRDADVHVLVTTESSGGGGRVFTLSFIGQEAFAGTDDVLEYATSQTDTDNEEREGFAQVLSLGLLRYVARTPLARQIDVQQRGGTRGGSAMATPDDDPWNFWVFRTRFNARVNGEESRKSKSLNGSVSANRTTDEWKIRLGSNARYDETEFELTDSNFTNISRNYSFDGRGIKSLGEHMGLGFGGSLVTTTFRNQDLSARLAPAFQYNLFPYTESTRRELTLSYTVGVNSFNYEELTIFNEMSEIRFDHSANMSLDFNQPWGDAGFTFEVSQFLDDSSKYRGVVFGDLEFRVARGLFFNINGSSSLVRDQIYLAKADLSDKEMLVRRRQLATNYEYRLSIGITYSFGSIYNNVVNSRFAGSSGGFVRAF